MTLNRRVNMFRGQCLRKRRYDEGLAIHAIKKMRKQGMEMESYYCPHCFGWHLTKKKDPTGTEHQPGTKEAQK